MDIMDQLERAAGTYHEDNGLKSERFGFTVFLSACIHAMIIFGIGFSYIEEISSEPALEITLAQYRSESAPDEADFLAQDNQSGSGTLDNSAAPSTPFESDFNDNVIQEVVPIPQAPQPSPQLAVQDLTVVTTLEADQLASELTEEQAEEPEKLVAEQPSPDDISLAIASLQAQLDLQRQEYAKRPRKYTISSASTKKSHDALYLDSWRKRIESVGNLNYPNAARIQELYGSLRLLVAILPDGSVSETRILQSSGHNVLDQAAMDIIRLASPFEPFPDVMRGEVDVLEIIRTWRFHEGNALTSY